MMFVGPDLGACFVGALTAAQTIASGAIAAGPVLFASSANGSSPPGVTFDGHPSVGLGFDLNQGLPFLGYANVACIYWSTSLISFQIDPVFLRNGLRIANPGSGIVQFSDGANAAGFQTTAPATSTSAGTKGSFAFDSGFIYICTATNTWKRVAVSTF